MTGTIATIPKYQFLDSLGVPLVNGTLTTYLTGTTTLTSTWQDQALSSLNTNPIVLDARGEATLWLDSAIVYKFVLKNEAGATLWTVENISGNEPLAEQLQIDLTVLENNLAASSGASLIGFIQAGPGAVARTVQNKNRDIVSVKDFGAVGDGSADDTAEIQLAFDYCQSVAKTAWFPDGVYRANGLTANCALAMSPDSIIKFNGSENGTALTISASNKDFGSINLDGNVQNCTALDITGSNNNFERLTVSNITATIIGLTSSNYGVRLTGASNNISEINCANFLNAGMANGSFPQAVLAYGASNNISSIVLRSCRSGLTCSTDVDTSVGTITAYAMVDNGVYQLTGRLNLGALEYYGSEEPIVFKGSARVGSIAMKGTGLGIGFQDCGDVSIGHIHIDKDGTGNTPSFVFRLRSGNVSCETITIARITGQLKGSTLFLADVGTAKFLSIGGCTIKFLYDAAVATSLASWANISAFKGFRLTNTYIEIIDLNNVLINTNYFSLTAGTVTKHSFLHDLDVQVYDDDGVTESDGTFRGISFAQPLIETRGVQWRTDIGPYLISSTLTGGIDDTANAIPTTGSWKRGKRLYEAFPASLGKEGWVCVLAGTPGTWKTFGSIS